MLHRLPEAMSRLAAVAPSEVILCTPVAAEVRFGLERLPEASRRRKLLEREYALIRRAAVWHDWTEPAAMKFGEVKAKLESAGRRIDDIDVAIASVALVLDGEVATCNARHFGRIEGLVVHDWSEAD